MIPPTGDPPGVDHSLSIGRHQHDPIAIGDVTGREALTPVAIAAGLATLELVQAPGFHAELGSATRQLVDGLRSFQLEAGTFTDAHSAVRWSVPAGVRWARRCCAA